MASAVWRQRTQFVAQPVCLQDSSSATVAPVRSKDFGFLLTRRLTALQEACPYDDSMGL